MSNLSRFFKKNKIKKENGTYAPSKAFVDEKGNPLDFVFRPVSSKENETIREKHTKDVQINGKPNMFRPKLDTAGYLNELIAESVVEPDLYNAELQDSYGVKTPGDLLYAMIDEPGEYQDLSEWVQNYHGFSTLDDKKAEAKN
jgi:hypothetical protein|nr:MAG TPA: tail assembly chaperone protein [Caudoviricetes sp.]